MLHIVVIAQSASELAPVGEQLDRARFEAELLVATTLDQLRRATGFGIDLILAYDDGPIDVLAALDFVTRRDEDLPFVVLSGSLGEAHAVALMRAGAHDVMPRFDLTRLVAVIQRELKEASVRREAKREARLTERTQTIAKVGGFEHDLRTNTMYWTREVHRLHGTDPEKHVPSLGALYDAAAPEYVAGLRDAVQRAFTSHEPWTYEYELVTTTGQRRWVRAQGDVEQESGHPVRLIGALGDISDRKKLEAQLLLTDRLSSMGSMAASVAHEINNPLAFVMANVPLVLERLGQARTTHAALVDELEPLLKDCLVGGERIRAIVSDLKVFTRAEEARPGPVDVAQVVNSVVRMSGNEARFRATVFVDMPPGLPKVLAVDSRLAQVITNLVVNALQALPAGRPQAENRITVRAHRWQREWVAIEVEDNGRGIPLELRERIFEPFFTTKPVGVGTGLGLAVCRTIIEGLGGRIELASDAGAPTVFRTLLPVAPNVPQELTPIESVALPSGAPKQRLLVVDDEPKLARAIARMLRTFEVDVANSGTEALWLLEQGRTYDAMLCDLMMPDMSGIELFSKLETLHAALAKRCLFMTGGIFTPEAKSFVDALPKHRIIEKPFTAPVVTTALVNLARD